MLLPHLENKIIQAEFEGNCACKLLTANATNLMKNKHGLLFLDHFLAVLDVKALPC